MNILSMFLGFYCFLLIYLYVSKQLNFDDHHEKATRIYRITYNETAGQVPGTRHVATVSPPVGPALKSEFPQIENAVRFRSSDERIITRNDKRYYEQGIFYVDPSVFEVFTFPFIEGDPATALRYPNNVVITESVARKYFGDEPAMGKTLTLDHETELMVTGILKDVPAYSHFSFDFLLPFEAFKVPYGYPVTLDDWGWISFHTYLLLKPGEDPVALQGQLPQFVTKHWSEDRARRFRLELQSLTDIYLGDVKHEMVRSGNRMYLYALSAAGLLILFTAVFNFTNLFTATSAVRAKEFGVRKVLGARKISLVAQLTSQSFLVAVFAGLLTIAIFLVSVPLHTQLGLAYDYDVSDYAEAAAVILAIAMLTGVAAGIYPSLFYSAMNVRALLKGTFRTGKAGIVIRRSLVFLQFTVSIALIASVFIINRQMDYLMSRDLGYAKNELLLLRIPGDQLVQKFPQLENQLANNPHVTAVSVGGGRMDGENGNVPIYTETTEEHGRPMNIDAVSFDFFKTIGVEMLAGREFTRMRPADTLYGVMINDAAARTFGWTPEEAIGRKIRVGNIVMNGEIIGVTPDFHFASLHSTVGPMVISFPRTRLQDIYIRFNCSSLTDCVESIRQDWQKVNPELPFDFVFLNDHLQRLYGNEQFFLLLFRLFTIVAIAISSLGLYGLVSQDVVFRLKEIGIRKVLGASVIQVVLLLLKHILMLVLIANIISWPLTYYFMQMWLTEFPYHTEMNVWLFLASGFLAMCYATVAVSFKAVRAALTNPVKSLRSE